MKNSLYDYGIVDIQNYLRSKHFYSNEDLKGFNKRALIEFHIDQDEVQEAIEFMDQFQHTI